MIESALGQRALTSRPWFGQIMVRRTDAACDAGDAFERLEVAVRGVDADDLDAGIREMIAHPGPVIADIAVAKDENCFPMIPSGAAHNEMILGEDQEGGVAGVTDEGKVLV